MLNLKAKPLMTITTLFGVDTSLISHNTLIDTAKAIKQSINQLTDTNKSIESKRLVKDIEKLTKALKAVVTVLDGETDQPEEDQVIVKFDLESKPLEEKTKVFGVLTDDLTKDDLLATIVDLKLIITGKKDLNEGLESNRLEGEIRELQSHIKGLVIQLDQLED